jgi:hypothetical protein
MVNFCLSFFLSQLEDKLKEKVLLAPTFNSHYKPDPKQIEFNAKRINFSGEKDVFSK